ncbi:PLAC8 family protein [Aspergillus stella-maris]|uniref:PLAC8 family protein n=1 Tax=Aspergillus stella-maris TaxID=1810926 RepID=UPI003CCE1438
MATNNSWKQGLFDCFSPVGTCLSATFFPCCLFNRVGARFRNQKVKSCGQDCCIYTGCCCLGMPCVPLCLRRRALREHFGLNGSLCGDFMAAMCCSCCVLSQLDNEVKIKEDNGQNGYQQPVSMVYGAK